MASDEMGRRRFLELSGTALVAAGAAELIGCASAPARPAPAGEITYFDRFGVTEALLADVLAAATSRGADSADVYFQHRVASTMGLQDGAVNRATSQVSLGV